jgi:hypothetical protein
MSTNHVNYVGPHTFDMATLQGKLVDLEEGGMQGLRTEQAGFQPMNLSLAEAMPAHGAAAGIPQDVYDHYVECNTTIAAIDERLVLAEKQVEILRESRAYHVDARQNDISLMVDAMRSRAQRRKDPSLLIPFEPVIKYNGQAAEKAALTRKKNEQAKANAASPPAPPDPPALPPAPPAPSAPPAPPV